MMRTALLALTITIAMVSGGKAQSNKPPGLDEVFNFGPKSVYTADFRAKFAQSLANYCQEILNALPTNTPAEDNWVIAANLAFPRNGSRSRWPIVPPYKLPSPAASQ